MPKTYRSIDNADCYFPPILGNGEISLAVDCEGGLNYSADEYYQKDVLGFDGIVVRCGRRCNLNSRTKTSNLFSFGKIIFEEGTSLKEWEQTLIVEEGMVESKCEYEDDVKIFTKAFIHPKLNIFAINKVFNCSEEKEASYVFKLEDSKEGMDELINITGISKCDEEMRVGFKIYGMDVYTGEVRLYIDTPYTVEQIDKGVRLKFNVKDNNSVTFYYYLEDNLEEKNYFKTLDELKNIIDERKYSGLLAECVQNYKEYFEQGFVKTSDEKLNDIYKTALYDLKCYTTKYSIPVGLNNGYWGGRYFAFDEYYGYLGLITSNRADLAKRVPEFRLNVCLPMAIAFASDCHKNEDSVDMARFFWQTGEKSEVELAAIGVWLNHVFHMPLIGIGAFELYEYTNDIDFLERAYKMIRACSMFFTKSQIYKDGDKYYIGKCNDLERLGAAAENPFMTSCGTIKLLECCAKAAQILGIDDEYRQECEMLAAKLRESLPVENEMYVPLLNCDQKSIAVFAGKFPFDAIDARDTKLLKSWEDFEKNGQKYGNMYPMGNGISTWYACWKAEAYARAGMPEKAYDALGQAMNSIGVFNELFEINEENIHYRPWFSTANGIFLSAVNESLLQSTSESINILPGIPKNDMNIEFKLAVKGGAYALVKIENGELNEVNIVKDGIDVTSEYEIFLRGDKVKL